jgi:hypothetical protein
MAIREFQLKPPCGKSLQVRTFSQRSGKVAQVLLDLPRGELRDHDGRPDHVSRSLLSFGAFSHPMADRA